MLDALTMVPLLIYVLVSPVTTFRTNPGLVAVPVIDLPITAPYITLATLDPRVPIVRFVNNPSLDPAPWLTLVVLARVLLMTPRVLVPVPP